MKNRNTYTTREGWLKAATDELRPYFAKLGYTLPDKIRFAIAFTSTGKRSRMPGECWHPDLSGDQHFEIIIRADLADPMEVLAVLIHELVHTLLPPEAKHGKAYRDIALKIGLEGPMRQTLLTPLLRDRLMAIADILGTLPHASLNFASPVNAEKKQKLLWVKAECPAACGYFVRLTTKWAKAALPLCPINHEHGRLVCDGPDDVHGDEEIITIEPV